MQTIIPPSPTGDRVTFGDSRLLDRIWARIHLNSESGCWEWVGQTSDRGYGYVRLNGRMRRVHRVVYEALVGDIPEGLTLDHLCRVRRCVNPAHLEPVTQAENTRRAVINVGRAGMKLKPRTHCPKGHPYNEANTATAHNGKRRCKACTRARQERYRQEKGQSQALPLPKAPLPRRNPLSAVFRKAARLIAVNGHFQGDHVPDPFDREMCIPHFLRPMSIVAAVKCAVSGDPHVTSLLADSAIARLALWLDGGPEYGDIFSLEAHVDEWGDAQGRSVESVVAVLEAAADASAVTL